MTAPRMAWVLIAAGCWTSAPPPSAARYRHSATVIRQVDSSGTQPDLIIAGGCSQFPAALGCELATTELLDQQTMVWSPGPRLSTGRFGHVAIRLRDFSILVTGGMASSGGTLNTDAARFAERLVFPQDTGWAPYSEPAGTLVQGRINHTATLLPDGRVLIVGGMHTVAGQLQLVTRAEIWDPMTGAFAPADPPATERAYHTATALPDGNVLIAGGLDASGQPIASTEIWDPTAPPSAQWRPGPPLPVPLSHHAASLVGAGRAWKLVVVGGLTAGWGVRAEAVAADVTPDATERAVVAPFVAYGALQVPRYLPATAQHPMGYLLVIGGNGADNQTLSDVEILDPRSGTWYTGPSLPVARGQYLTASPLPGGRVLVAGGYGALQSADVLSLCSADQCNAWLPSCMCPVECPDSDGDGLSDAWETGGIDTDLDGISDVFLDGADPAARDLYVEMDYMVKDGVSCPPGPAGVPGIDAIPGCFKPFQSTLDTMARIYAGGGVHLHLEVGDPVEYAGVTTMGSCAGKVDGAAVTADIRQRHSPAWRRGLYHYVLNTDSACEVAFEPQTGHGDVGYYAGMGEMPGDDVNLAGKQKWPTGEVVQTRPIKQGIATVHEIGHNLGLGHDGALTAPPDAPNYTSVMGGKLIRDPDFDPDGDLDVDQDGDVDQLDVDRALARADYSRGGLGVLDENALAEGAGIPGATLPYAVTFSCPPGVTRAPTVPCTGAAGPFRRACSTLKSRSYVRLHGVDHVVQSFTVVSRTANQIDWNCDGKINLGTVGPLNINGDFHYTGTSTPLTSSYTCTVDADCAGGVCSAGLCRYTSWAVTGPITEVFPGQSDWDVMRFGFQCEAAADVAGEDLPVFSAP